MIVPPVSTSDCADARTYTITPPGGSPETMTSTFQCGGGSGDPEIDDSVCL